MEDRKDLSPAFAHFLAVSDPTLSERILRLGAMALGMEPQFPPNLPELFSNGRGRPGTLVADMATVGALGGFLEWIRDPGRRTKVLLLARARESERAAKLLEAGVDFYLREPSTDPELSATLKALLRSVDGGDPPPADAEEAVQLESPEMRELFRRLQSVAPLEALNLLLMGETGTGKQGLARMVHRLSRRQTGPFAEIDCAALPGNLVESELFGHEAGAFTDARSRQSGLLESAQGGTLFLDEVGELPLEAQAKLLRALELRRFRRVGGREEILLEVRIVSATNRNLAEEVRQGRFRADLYYRLNGVSLHVSPLRARPDDIVTLAAFFYARACSQFAFQALPLSEPVVDILRRHPWPGNIRELKSLIHRVVALTRPGDPILPELVRRELAEHPSGAAAGPDSRRVPTLREAEEDLARRALAASGGNKTAAARLIGVSKPTYFRMLREFGINS